MLGGHQSRTDAGPLDSALGRAAGGRAGEAPPDPAGTSGRCEARRVERQPWRGDQFLGDTWTLPGQVMLPVDGPVIALKIVGALTQDLPAGLVLREHRVEAELLHRA